MMNVQFISNDWVMNFGMVLFFLVFSMLFLVFIVIIKSFFIKKKYKSFEPEISVIIPAYNEEKNIKNCLNSIFKSNYDKEKIEIICVDDGSKDNTLKILEKIKDIKLINSVHKGKSHALNLGIKQSKYDYVLTVDADTVLHKNFIKEIIRPFSNKKVGATNGIILIKNPKKVIEHFQKIEYNLNNLIRYSFSKVFNNGIWFFGAAACFNKKILEKTGLFQKNMLTEDMDMSLKIFELGYDVLTVKAPYYTNACNNLIGLFRQRMRWFFGGLQCSVKYRRLFKKSFAISFLLFNQFFWAVFSILIFPLLIYQIKYWLPAGFPAILSYLFRWFSIFGPIYVLYKLPVWGLSFINIFGVLAGIITALMILISIKYFKEKLTIQDILVIIFYFPYTLLLNLSLIMSLFNYILYHKT